ncbi:helix-turn-helix domain-containing protein [Actinocatenispora rupis]|uniref:Helix-turn-helix domain-containing protein n=1 Tax=Actinocatenispora rupis TaxID=519421 RepID=A0A8J3J834_9ACTN|nr:helix-turn-helix transcriptional regulator [Actinocatenispora rupis]GID15758.1 hypothetical protein Aru02nite_66470 [Actinocatenispora rupis]
MASDRAHPEVDGFASWLRQLRLDAGDPSLRELSRLTREVGAREVPRSTLADAFAGHRLPSYDTAMAVSRALAGPDGATECHRRWRAARAAQRGAEPPTEPTAASAPPVAADGPPTMPEGARPADDGAAPGPEPVAPDHRRGRRLVGALAAAVVLATGVTVAVVVTRGDAPGAAGAGTGRRTDPTASAAHSPLQLHAEQVSPCAPLHFAHVTRQQAQQDVAATHGYGDPSHPLPYPIDPGTADLLVSQSQISLTVQSAETESVLLTGLSVLVRGRRPAPTAGILVSFGECGAHLPIRYFATDVGRSQPAVGPEPGTPDFPFTVSRTDPEEFQIDVANRMDDCTFDLVLRWTAKGRPGRTVLDNGGHHYQLSGPGRIPAYYGGLNGRYALRPDPDPARTG